MSDRTPAADVWQGRLPGGLDPRARRLNDSLPVDQRLWPEELALTRAYAPSLVEAGVLDAAEAAALAAACEAIDVELEHGRLRLEGEDVHSAIEAELIRRAGDAGRRLHTGRSRNDQVSTLLRQRVMRVADETIERVRDVERALVAQAREAGELAVAAYTHMQPAQPVRLAHLWMAHVAALERDEERFAAARQAADSLPLGAGAIGGSPLRYDRLALAARLGMSRAADNSVDAVGDRDFVLELLGAASVLGVHLSRLAEDLVLWCAPAFGWFRAPEGFSTGSSLLPQKRNPDIFELARGKSARLIANANRMAIVLKGLPSGYQKDLQEDKEALFDTADTLEALLDALAPAIGALEVVPERVAASLSPDLLAVELADALVEHGVPFRDAHTAVGRLWAAAEAAGSTPAALPLADRLAISPHFTDEALARLDVESALARREHAPGGGSRSVAAQIARAEARLGLGSAGIADLPAQLHEGDSPLPASRITLRAVADVPSELPLADGVLLRRAVPSDVPGIARLMSGFVAQGILLPRPLGELYQCLREFHVAVEGEAIVGCGALRLLWEDLGEVRSLAVRPDRRGRGIGAAILDAVVADARALGLPRVIALTREVPFFESYGFTVAERDALPRKVWTDCVQCPRRHACDEIAVILDLAPVRATAPAEVA